MAEHQFTSEQFAYLVGRSKKTLYTWRLTKKLEPLRDLSNRYVYTEEHYKKATGLDLPLDYLQKLAMVGLN